MQYDKYTFFYSGPFSQWFACEFVIDGVKYNCAEQYMMHMKALIFGDTESAELIMKAKHPRQQKSLGRSVKNFDASRWNEIARDLVYKGNYAKFQQSEELRRVLEETKGTLLVEASPTDTIWGIGLPMDASGLEDPANWLGTNWLGEAITKVREDLEENIYRVEGFQWSQ